MSAQEEPIDWDDRQAELHSSTKDKRLSVEARAAIVALLSEGEAFNENAFPSHGHGFGSSERGDGRNDGTASTDSSHAWHQSIQ